MHGWRPGTALVGVLTVLPTPMLAVNILFAVALFTLTGAMVWLDRQDRMPAALPWFHLLVVTPVLAFALLMISFQPNNYQQHPAASEFEPSTCCFFHFCRSLPTWLLQKVGRPWLFGTSPLSLLFVFDMTVATKCCTWCKPNRGRRRVLRRTRLGMQPLHSTSMQVAFGRSGVQKAFLILMPLMLIGARLVHRRRRGGDISEGEERV